MKPEARPVTDLLLAMAGPMVWAGHLFSLYLAEALLCPEQGRWAHAPVHLIGAWLTVFALAAMLKLAIHQRPSGPTARRSAALFVALPLTLLSTVAVLWTTLPLFLLPACAAGSS
jgi:hypothetical protein